MNRGRLTCGDLVLKQETVQKNEDEGVLPASVAETTDENSSAKQKALPWPSPSAKRTAQSRQRLQLNRELLRNSALPEHAATKVGSSGEGVPSSTLGRCEAQLNSLETLADSLRATSGFNATLAKTYAGESEKLHIQALRDRLEELERREADRVTQERLLQERLSNSELVVEQVEAQATQTISAAMDKIQALERSLQLVSEENAELRNEVNRHQDSVANVAVALRGYRKEHDRKQQALDFELDTKKSEIIALKDANSKLEKRLLMLEEQVGSVEDRRVLENNLRAMEERCRELADETNKNKQLNRTNERLRGEVRQLRQLLLTISKQGDKIKEALQVTK